MSGILLLAGLMAGASAAAVPLAGSCCFQLTAAGGKAGTVGQLADGQNRVGGNYSPATYCINNGAISDAHGRGCILTPPTTQFQCDTGAKPTSGCSINSSGQVQYHGSNQFYACPATNSEYNLYTTPVPNQKKCVKVTLSTGGKCVGSGASSSSSSKKMSSTSKPVTSTKHTTSTKPRTITKPTTSMKTTSMKTSTKPGSIKPTSSTKPGSVKPTSSTKPVTTSKSTKPATTMKSSTSSKAATSSKPTSASGSACKTSLVPGAYQTPHLIVPVSKSQPDNAYGTQYNATISSDKCTIFNFDIPQPYAGKTCTSVFLFPQQKDLQTSAFTFSGAGSISFDELASAATQQTTYKNAPAKMSHLSTLAVKPGNAYVVATGPCEAGKKISIEACSEGGLSLEYFEDWNPSPIGLFINKC